MTVSFNTEESLKSQEYPGGSRLEGLLAHIHKILTGCGYIHPFQSWLQGGDNKELSTKDVW